MADIAEARRLVADGGRRLLADGLVVGTAGNLSMRVGDLVAVSPSGVPYPEVAAEDVVVVDLEGNVVDGARRPSSELPLHLAAYGADPEARAVVHTHAPAATAAGLVADELPAVHYLILDLGGPVPVLPFALPGSGALADGVGAALASGRRPAVLLRNHGTLTLGPTPARAHARSVALEWLADVWLRALASGRDPALLTADQLAATRTALGDYFDRAT